MIFIFLNLACTLIRSAGTSIHFPITSNEYGSKKQEGSVVLFFVYQTTRPPALLFFLHSSDRLFNNKRLMEFKLLHILQYTNC